MNVESWRAQLDAGHVDRAWTSFIDRYHRLIDATIRKVVADHDDALDAFAHACERLRANDLGRLRKFSEDAGHSAKFSTWLVVVVRNLTLDWRRARDGRPRHTPPPGLSALGQQIYQLVLVQRCSHVEAYEIIVKPGDNLKFGAFLQAVAETYRAVDPRRRSTLNQATGGFAQNEAVVEPQDDQHAEELAQRLDVAMHALTNNEREAIRLFVVEDMPAADVARAVGWSDAKSVYNRVRRALLKARAVLGQSD